jgi:16S rRNA (uracil1498-N3)-methyltransferase
VGKCNGKKEVKMYHFFSEHENIHDTYIDIVGSDVNHIKNVLRFHVGDSLLISSGDNIDYTCHITQMEENYIRADIDSTDEKGRELPSKIYLFQGLPKADKMELVIQKSVELGAYEIIPVAMKRSVVKLDSKKAEAKVKRWNGIAESAAKQSKRSIIPQVSDVMTFSEAVKYASENCVVKLLPYECADGMEKTKRLIEQITPGENVAVFIGPEGGFDLAELELAKEAGCEIITLGKRILRTETAPLMLLSVLMYHFEE